MRRVVPLTVTLLIIGVLVTQTTACKKQSVIKKMFMNWILPSWLSRHIPNGWKCFNQKCPAVECDKTSTPVYLDGECCPVCRHYCLYQRIYYDHGKGISPTVCVSCTCNNGNMQCEKQDKETQCPQLDCPKSEHIEIHGQCCPVCNDGSVKPIHQECPAVPEDCDFLNRYYDEKGCPACYSKCYEQGKYYKHGDVYSPSVCVSCSCNNGDMVCWEMDKEKQCPPLDCQKSERIEIPDQCCPVCKRKPKNGRVDNQECPAVECDNPVHRDDERCPRCPFNCLYQGIYYDHGQSTSPVVCVTCTCNDGNMVCDRKDKETQCPRLDCPKSERFEIHDQCCPVCMKFGKRRSRGIRNLTYKGNNYLNQKMSLD